MIPAAKPPAIPEVTTIPVITVFLMMTPLGNFSQFFFIADKYIRMQEK
jgi:hypothetical protein